MKKKDKKIKNPEPKLLVVKETLRFAYGNQEKIIGRVITGKNSDKEELQFIGDEYDRYYSYSDKYRGYKLSVVEDKEIILKERDKLLESYNQQIEELQKKISILLKV